MTTLSDLFTRSTNTNTPSLMFQGTCSNAGKSVLTAALCRILLQDGVSVAPFKSQNMSLNSFVTRDGGEMGRAQVVQAQASLLDPDVRMNPILLKPSSDTGSQVIVNGRAIANMSVEDYVAYKPEAFRQAMAAYDSLAAEHDVIILEGAGSPAEINLKHHDIVNMPMARYAGSKVVLVGDIDRGGVFASFVGTMAILDDWERELTAGFVVNRFRGRKSLLDDALRFTHERTGKPVFGVVDYITSLGLPEEDSVTFKAGLFESHSSPDAEIEIGLIDLPHISNFTDFEPFLAEPDVTIRIVTSVHDIRSVSAVILPGSKNVMADLGWLRQTGLAEKIIQIHHEKKTPIIGICGGFQMLGRIIHDPHQIESSGKSIEGLGLLDMGTVLEQDKTLVRKEGTHLPSSLDVHGYEIHHGQSRGSLQPLLDLHGTNAGAMSRDNLLWGSYLHGIFDADPFRRWFIDSLRKQKGLAPADRILAHYDLEPAFDRLAATVRQQLDMDSIYQLLRL